MRIIPSDTVRWTLNSPNQLTVHVPPDYGFAVFMLIVGAVLFFIAWIVSKFVKKGKRGKLFWYWLSIPPAIPLFFALFSLNCHSDAVLSKSNGTLTIDRQRGFLYTHRSYPLQSVLQAVVASVTVAHEYQNYYYENKQLSFVLSSGQTIPISSWGSRNGYFDAGNAINNFLSDSDSDSPQEIKPPEECEWVKQLPAYAPVTSSPPPQRRFFPSSAVQWKLNSPDKLTVYVPPNYCAALWMFALGLVAAIAGSYSVLFLFAWRHPEQLTAFKAQHPFPPSQFSPRASNFFFNAIRVVVFMKKPLWTLLPTLVFWIPAALLLTWTDTAVFSMKDETLTKDTQLFSYHSLETCPLQIGANAYVDSGDWTQELSIISPGCDTYEMEYWSNREGNYQAGIAINTFIYQYKKMKLERESMRQQGEQVVK
ncbi:MAG: hypothetical protein ABSC76_06930 [Terracidiphilus sp.]